MIVTRLRIGQLAKQKRKLPQPPKLAPEKEYQEVHAKRQTGIFFHVTTFDQTPTKRRDKSANEASDYDKNADKSSKTRKELEDAEALRKEILKLMRRMEGEDKEKDKTVEVLRNVKEILLSNISNGPGHK
eukprot:TRINITY_DN6293_c0_g1_i3.p3 TRINITY_DN6293_c0_g1~~TRINITY_DN6293_c0_g1_i3.p3  ORF type:complete len:130 (-),score=12.17 TRINITY_DN6293_c0_g1_i3:224-613(-)